MSLVIPGQMPGLNDAIAGAKRHWVLYALKKRTLTQKVAVLARAAKMPKIADPICVRCTWYEPDARRDPDNIAAGVKYILDGLVAAGVLQGDDRRWVVGLDHRFPPPDPENPRVEVYLSREFTIKRPNQAVEKKP